MDTLILKVDTWTMLDRFEHVGSLSKSCFMVIALLFFCNLYTVECFDVDDQLKIV